MSLGIAFKGAEGIVLAADSRVTLTTTNYDSSSQEVFHSYYDNATKLLQVKEQRYVGAVTFGAGTIGQQSPRTPHSYLPEFEAELSEAGVERLNVVVFATKLSEFFMRQWQATQMPVNSSPINFLVGGYDIGDTYGKIFEFAVPTNLEPTELQSGPAAFGIAWGGQIDITHRLIKGFDEGLLSTLQEILNLTDEERDHLGIQLGNRLQANIPFQFLPLQDCVDLSILLIRTTMAVQTWIPGIRGVGGPIDVATITRTEGFRSIQQKTVTGERVDG